MWNCRVHQEINYHQSHCYSIGFHNNVNIANGAYFWSGIKHFFYKCLVYINLERWTLSSEHKVFHVIQMKTRIKKSGIWLLILMIISLTFYLQKKLNDIRIPISQNFLHQCINSQFGIAVASKSINNEVEWSDQKSVKNVPLEIPLDSLIDFSLEVVISAIVYKVFNYNISNDIYRNLHQIHILHNDALHA